LNLGKDVCKLIGKYCTDHLSNPKG
jgi:hypothetical protein